MDDKCKVFITGAAVLAACVWAGPVAGALTFALLKVLDR